MSANNFNSDQQDLMNKVFMVIALIIGGYLAPIISSVMIPLFFSGFAVLVGLLLGWSMDGAWDETVEYVVVFANFGKIFSPMMAILLPLVYMIEQSEWYQKHKKN